MKCRLCEENFDNTFSLSRHVKSIHGIKYLEYYKKYLYVPNNSKSKEPCPQCKRQIKHHSHS